MLRLVACLLVSALFLPATAATQYGRQRQRQQQPTAYAPQSYGDVPGMIYSGTPIGVPPSADCALRTLAWEYGKKLQPNRSGFRTLYDALQLHACNVTAPPLLAQEWQPPLTHSSIGKRRTTLLYVDPRAPQEGTNVDSLRLRGSLKAPFRSIHAALNHSRSLPKPLDIVLRQGTHFIGQTVNLGPEDSGLRFRNYAGEEAIVSGATKVDLQWEPSTACTGCTNSRMMRCASFTGSASGS